MGEDTLAHLQQQQQQQPRQGALKQFIGVRDLDFDLRCLADLRLRLQSNSNPVPGHYKLPRSFRGSSLTPHKHTRTYTWKHKRRSLPCPPSTDSSKRKPLFFDPFPRLPATQACQ